MYGSGREEQQGDEVQIKEVIGLAPPGQEKQVQS